VQAAIDIPQAAIKAFCQRHHIRRLALFGSVLCGDFGPESDVDVLVEFEPTERVGYFTLVAIQLELADLIGREVDLLTPGAFHPRFRNKVMAGAQVVYRAAPSPSLPL
jgi:predicted nucleotidyltransferase